MKKILGSFLLLFLIGLSCQARNVLKGDLLKDGWVVHEGKNTYRTSIPVTAMGVLISNGVYKEDILTGLNYRQVDKSFFDHSWRFEKSFALSALKPGQHVLLLLDGIDYAANVFVNNRLVASRDTVQGPFRQYTFDVTQWIKPENKLSIEVFRAQTGDPNIGFVDWNPQPADQNMGIFREVHVHVTQEVSMAHTCVRSVVNTQTLKEAWLTMETELENHSTSAQTGLLKGDIGGVHFSYPVSLSPNEKKVVQLTSKEIPALHFINPRLWWCNNLGHPEMYRLHLQFAQNKKISDQTTISFGIRQVDRYMTKEGYLGFKLNGKPVLIKGAGWTDDLFLRNTLAKDEIQIKYAKDMNLNTIRCENIWGTSQHLYDLCDKYGLLVLAGWSCQWEWEEYLGAPCDDYGGIKGPEKENLVYQSFKDQVLWLRNHPSIIAWFVGSDKFPRPELEKRYQSLLKEIDDRAYISSAKEAVSTVSGPSGTKMDGPYEYVGPNYWYVDRHFGGAYGFNTETGIGAQLPVYESICKMIPADQLWPIGDCWNYHTTASTSASPLLNSLHTLTTVITEKYGAPINLRDYLRKADLTDYEGTRSMFEAFRVNRPHTTGIVQWMLNSAWPALYWQLYDYYLIPTSAYYAVKKANEPSQLVYDYKDNGVYLVTEDGVKKAMKAEIRLFDIKSEQLLSQSVLISKSDSILSKLLFTIPEIKGNEFLSLRLTYSDGKELADNFYCLSQKQDTYQWDKSDWVYTPMKTYADFKDLSLLDTLCNCTYKTEIRNKAGEEKLILSMHNPTDKIAFFVRLALKDRSGNLIFPIFWDDNYITILPGETKTISAILPEIRDKRMNLEINGWNVQRRIIKIDS